MTQRRLGFCGSELTHYPSVDTLAGECGAPGLWDLESQREAAPRVSRARQGAGSRLTATDGASAATDRNTHESGWLFRVGRWQECQSICCVWYEGWEDSVKKTASRFFLPQRAHFHFHRWMIKQI